MKLLKGGVWDQKVVVLQGFFFRPLFGVKSNHNITQLRGFPCFRGIIEPSSTWQTCASYETMHHSIVVVVVTVCCGGVVPFVQWTLVEVGRHYWCWMRAENKAATSGFYR